MTDTDCSTDTAEGPCATSTVLAKPLLFILATELSHVSSVLPTKHLPLNQMAHWCRIGPRHYDFGYSSICGIFKDESREREQIRS